MDPERKKKGKIKGIKNKVSENFKSMNSEGLLTNISKVGLNSIVVAFITLLFHLIMSRKLGPEMYGELGTLLSIATAIVMCLSAVCFVITRFISYYRTREQYDKMKFLAHWAFVFFVMIGFAAFLITAIFSKYIAEFLNIPDYLTIILFGLIVWISFLMPIIDGILRGLEEFNFLGNYKLVEWILRLLISGVLVFIGFKLNSVVVSLAIGSTIAIIFTNRALKKIYINQPYKIKLGEIYRFLVPVLLACFFFSVLTNIDVILVKHFFDANSAGYYAAASLLAKVVFGIAFGAAGVMFPKIVHHMSNGENRESKLVLRNTINLMAIIGIVVSCLLAIFPHQISRVLFGKQYDIGWMLSIYVFAMFFLAMVSILFMYNLAAKKYHFIWIFFIAVIVEIYQIIRFHTTLYSVVWTLFCINGFLLLFFLIENRKELFEKIN